jgi:alkanesulfonate monooxygenase SsuD/methylene tetrahydromethanopterin reductase-like flavin-dependent oxidoreductase (luciferase family)
VVIMPGLSPLLGSTEAEAARLEEELADLVHPEVGVWMLSENLNFPLYGYDIKAKLPIAEIRAVRSPTANVETTLRQAEAHGYTIEQAARVIARSRSHQSFVGTPEGLADLMQDWLESGACDGFNLMPPYFPEQLRVFVEQAVPVLQKRGIFRQEYEGRTLRENLGLARPAGRGS